MTTPASGAISLNDIGTELGYSNASTVTLRDDNVRYLSGATTNATLQISLSDLYNKTSSFTHVVTNKYWAAANAYGYAGGSAGTIIPTITKSPIFGSQPIYFLYWQGGGSTFVTLNFQASFPNDGFTSIVIAGNTFLRTSATTFSNSGGSTYWLWNTATNPFGTSNGTYVPVTFNY